MMRQHSKTAWDIASRYSGVLASETRDLAAAIDKALEAERGENIEAAAKVVERHSLPTLVNVNTAIFELKMIAHDVRALSAADGAKP